MKLILDNPYRIAGILSNATEKEVVKQKSKITRSAAIGRQVNSEFDFPFMPNVDRTDVDEVKRAFSGIEQNQDKVCQSLLWFLKVNPFDDTAINYLINGNKEKAIEIWEKVTGGKEVTSKNYSCFNNIGTLKLLSSSKEEIKEGIEAKIKLLESKSFADFAQTITDQTYTINNQKQTEKFIDDILKQFNKNYSSKDTLLLFDNCNGTTKKYLKLKLTEEPLYKIETQIESTKNKRKTSKKNAYKFGLSLFENYKGDLTTLKSLLGTSDLKYKMIADNLAKEVMQCGIDYFKVWQDEKDPSKEGLELLKYAKSIAVSNQVIERLDSNIEGMEEFKDKEINQAIAILSSIKLAYEKAISEIDAHIAGMLMKMSYNQTINYSKVNKMKANCLDWSKVVEVVSNEISMNDIATIQRCSNQIKVSEYKKLVDYLFNKLGPLQINQLKYICFWKDVRAAQAKSTAKKVGSTISSATDSGCYIATMAYGNFDHPQVLKLREFRDVFLSKYYFGQKFITFYYKHSPSMVEKLKNQKFINALIRKILNLFIKIIRK